MRKVGRYHPEIQAVVTLYSLFYGTKSLGAWHVPLPSKSLPSLPLPTTRTRSPLPLSIPSTLRGASFSPLPSMQRGASFSSLTSLPFSPSYFPFLQRGASFSPLTSRPFSPCSLPFMQRRVPFPPLRSLPLPSPPCNGSITMTAGSRGVRRGTGKHELTSSLFFCSPPETRVALFDVTAYVTATSARWCCAGRGLAHTFLRPFFARGSHIALSLRGYS